MRDDYYEKLNANAANKQMNMVSNKAKRCSRHRRVLQNNTNNNAAQHTEHTAHTRLQ